MKKYTFTALSILLVIIFLDTFSYSQKNLPTAPATGVTVMSYDERISEYWKDRVVKCGDSSYIFRESKGGGQELYEIKGVTFETNGKTIPRTDRTQAPGSPRDVDWSGNSVARFESYRKFVSPGSWDDWKAGGSEFVYFDGYRGYISQVPGQIHVATCTEVSLVTKNSMLPDEFLKMTLKDLEGGTFTLDDQKDKVILINLWATWCGPCRMEMPELIDLQNRFRDKGLVVIGLDVDPEGVEIVKEFGRVHGLNYMIGFTTPELHRELLGITQFTAIPQSFLIQNGRLIKVYKGYNPTQTKADREALIRSLLDK